MAARGTVLFVDMRCARATARFCSGQLPMAARLEGLFLGEGPLLVVSEALSSRDSEHSSTTCPKTVYAHSDMRDSAYFANIAWLCFAGLWSF